MVVGEPDALRTRRVLDGVVSGGVVVVDAAGVAEVDKGFEELGDVVLACAIEVSGELVGGERWGEFGEGGAEGADAFGEGFGPGALVLYGDSGR